MDGVNLWSDNIRETKDVDINSSEVTGLVVAGAVGRREETGLKTMKLPILGRMWFNTSS